MKRLFFDFKVLGISLLAVLLLYFSFSPTGSFGLILFAFTPLFWLRDLYLKEGKSLIQYMATYFLTFLAWHYLSLTWFFNMSLKNAAISCSINSILMTLPFLIALIASRKSSKLFYWGIISLWLSFELLHLSWELGFPLLTLGHALGNFPEIIQWYSITGVLGGSLWILILNILAYEGIKLFFNRNKIEDIQHIRRLILCCACFLFLPLLFSILLLNSFKERGQKLKILAIHPNIDCYTEKFELSQKELIDRYIDLTLKHIKTGTDYVLWPETALTNMQWIERINEFSDIALIRNSLSAYPNVNLITGATIYELHSKGKPSGKIPPLITYSDRFEQSYYTYNAALQINMSNDVLVRTKEKLVPFEETIPYPEYLLSLQNIIGSMNGNVFSHRKTNEDIFFADDGSKVTPLICYELCFGNVVKKYAKKGAGAFFILLNEGWYKDLNAAKLLVNISRIRAIETRRSIVRSSNYGITNSINAKGKIVESIEGLDPTVLQTEIPLSNKVTVYSIVGDFIGYAGVISTVLFLFSALLKNLLSSKR